MGIFSWLFGKKKVDEEEHPTVIGGRKIATTLKSMRETGDVLSESESDEIDSLKAEIDELDKQLDLPEVANSYSKYHDVMTKIDEKQSRVEDLVRKTLPRVDDKTLLDMGLSKDSNGKIIFYHVTTKKYLGSILSEGLKPAGTTNKSVWRAGNEKTGAKLDKIYLTPSSKVDVIKNGVEIAADRKARWSDEDKEAVVLEVHVDEKGLYPDEDSGEDDWISSVKSGAGTCTFKGEVSPENIKIVGEGNY